MRAPNGCMVRSCLYGDAARGTFCAPHWNQLPPWMKRELRTLGGVDRNKWLERLEMAMAELTIFDSVIRE